MQKCIDPVLCYTNDKKRQFRHFSKASPAFKALHQTVFDCGSCIFCRKRRSSELAMRCVLHASLYKQNCFLTLTYDESRKDYHNNFQYSDIQKFKKRLRAYCERTHKKKVQIFNVHEYGKNGKKHWHLVVFNHQFEDKILHTVSNGNPLYKSLTLAELWPFGFSTIGDVSLASALYQAQYTQKDFKNNNANNFRKSHSKHSGIGRDYFIANYDQILKLGYIPFNGSKSPIPRYFLKIAHRHWAHFNDTSYFYDLPWRKKVYSVLKPDEPKKDLADLYEQHMKNRKEKIEENALEWKSFIDENLFSKQETDFQKSGSNYLYDLQNKTKKESF